MKVSVVVSQAELDEDGTTTSELKEKVCDALNDITPQLPGFDVEIIVKD